MSQDRRGRIGFKSAMDRLDEWIRAGGERLAGRGGPSRRGFLGSAALGAAAAAGTGLLSGGEAEGQAACNLPAGCFGTESVNVCYSPWRVIAAEPGRTDGVILRKAPSFSAPPVTRTDGVTPTVIPINAHFGRCSNRTGSV